MSIPLFVDKYAHDFQNDISRHSLFVSIRELYFKHLDVHDWVVVCISNSVITVIFEVLCYLSRFRVITSKIHCRLHVHIMVKRIIKVISGLWYLCNYIHLVELCCKVLIIFQKYIPIGEFRLITSRTG